MSDLDSLNDQYGANSRVISFRLNLSDAIERRALEYLVSQEGKGKKPRQIIAEALVRAGERDDRMVQMYELQRRAVDILEKVESGQVRLVASDGQESEESTDLAENTKQGIIRLFKPLRTMEEDGGE